MQLPFLAARGESRTAVRTGLLSGSVPTKNQQLTEGQTHKTGSPGLRQPIRESHLGVLVLDVCLVVVLICYASSIRNDFVFDDLGVVAGNPEIRSIAPLRFLASSYWGDLINAGIYRPLTLFSFAVDYALWGRWAPGCRTTNLLLHALNGWLVFWLARGLLASAAPAWVATMVYLAHPVHTEAVVSIVGRGELLAATFFFGAWLLFRKGRTGWAAAAFLLSLLAKESAIMLPAVVVLEIWLLRQGGFRKVLDAWRRLTILATAAAAYLALRFWVLGAIGIPKSAQYLGGNLSIGERWMTSGRVFLEYFRLTVAPIDVAGDYDFNSIPLPGLESWDAWVGLLLVAAAVTVALVVRKSWPAASLGVLFFFTALIPVSNWIVPIGVLMAERFLYIPTFGIALLAGIGWAAIPSKRGRLAIGLGVLVIAAVLSNIHNLSWRDEMAFYENMVRVVPDNVRARFGYGFGLLQRGRVDEAEREFRAALQISPRSPRLISALAAVHLKRDQLEHARALLDRALENNPRHGFSLWMMADYLARVGRLTEAEQTYRLAVENTLFPPAGLLFSWGRMLDATGRKSEALAVYQRVIEIDPDTEMVVRQHSATQAGGPR